MIDADRPQEEVQQDVLTKIKELCIKPVKHRPDGHTGSLVKTTGQRWEF